ncbi:MAG: MgtC/SapB family protein [Candidatus Odinarchaeota archaeon]|nr:MgtC/SapB family protein [Candidatus Odinarchaeota archaeon]
MFEIFESEYARIVIGFLVGALIGLERQMAEQSTGKYSDGDWRPGVRTFGLISLMGSLSMVIYQYMDGTVSLIVLTFSVVSSISVIVSYTVIRLTKASEAMGVTTSVALALSFLSGILAGIGEITLSVTVSVFITFILAVKRSTERLLMNVSYKEVSSALQIGVLLLLILPLIPDVTDPIFHQINIRILFMFMLMVLGIEFTAYVAMKNLGTKTGIIALAIVGSMMNSEATSVNIARLSDKVKIEEVRGRVLSSGIMASNATMVLRTILLTSLLLLPNPEIILKLVISLLPTSVLGYTVAYFRMRRTSMNLEEKMDIGNPLSYKAAVRSLVVFFLVAFGSLALQSLSYYLGLSEEVALISASFLGGFFSILAVSISAASLYSSGVISADFFVRSVVVGTLSALMNKVFYVRGATERDSSLKEAILDVSVLSSTLILSNISLIFIPMVLGSF